MIPLMVATSARVRGRVLSALAGCALVVLVGSVSAANMVLGSSTDEVSATTQAETLFRESLVHLNGQGVPKDLLRAKALLEQSAELGHVDAQQKLGRMYFFLPGHVDLEKTRYWWLQAARQGSAKAQYQLAILHIKHLGPNPVDALAWMQLAYENGDPRAKRVLPRLEQRLSVEPAVLAQRVTELKRSFNPAEAEREDGWLADVLQDVVESTAAAEPEPVEPEATGVLTAEMNILTPESGQEEDAVAEPEAPGDATQFNDGYYVQLAAVHTHDSASEFAVSVNGKHAEILGRMQARVLQKQSGPNGFKVWVGAFAKRAEANSLCGELQSRDQACFVVRL